MEGVNRQGKEEGRESGNWREEEVVVGGGREEGGRGRKER